MNINTHCLWLAATCTLWAWLATPLTAQTPATTTAATASAQSPLHVPAPPAPGFWGSVSMPLSKCQTCWHNCSLRKLLKNGMAPLSAATGGLIGGDHNAPPPPATGVSPLPPPPPPAVNAAATIKIEAAQAEARVDAVRYLATVDCHWYPEAEAGLIASLRADRSECVRLAAAQSLSRGCCCTKRTIAALQVCASGSNVDGNPGERCPRVRWAAVRALQTCLLQCDANHFSQPAYQDRPETPEDPLASDRAAAAALPEFYRRLDRVPAERLLLEVQRTVALLDPQQVPSEAMASQPRTGLYGIWAASSGPMPSSEQPSAESSYATLPAASEPVAAAPASYPLARPLEPYPAVSDRRQLPFPEILPASAPLR